MPTTRSPAGSPSSVSECGLASGLWLKSTQAYRKMRRQHPLDHRQDAQLARGASQEAANRKPFPRDRQSPSAEAVSSLPAPLREVVGAPQDPSPLIFRQKPGSLSSQGHRFATARRSSQLVPLKRSLPLCATGRQEPLLDSYRSRIWRAARKGGSAQTQTKSCCSRTVGRGGGEAEWGCFCPWNVPVNKHVNTLRLAGSLQHSLKSLLSALPVFIFSLHVIS